MRSPWEMKLPRRHPYQRQDTRQEAYSQIPTVDSPPTNDAESGVRSTRYLSSALVDSLDPLPTCVEVRPCLLGSRV